jgi:hypothetical protein
MNRKTSITWSLWAGTVLLAATGASPATDYPDTIASQGPAGYWRLNDSGVVAPEPQAVNSGTLGAAANGQYIETIRGVAGIPGAGVNTAVFFPGLVDGNRVRVPFQPGLNVSGPFTVEFWAKPGVTNTLVCPASSVEFIASPTQRNGWLFYQSDPTSNTGQGWLFRVYKAGGLAAATTVTTPIMNLDTNQYYHVVGVYDGTSIYLYTNGSLAASAAVGAAFRPNTNSAIPLTFGARADGVSGYFTDTGTIDEPAFYATALSATQVMAHYQAGTNGAAPAYSTVVLADNPAGYWHLGETPASKSPNSGSYGADVDATYNYNAQPGQPGPSPSSTPTTFAGFEAGNKAPIFDGAVGNVQIPSLYLDTNRVTITCWVKPNGSQLKDAGLVFSRQGTTTSGLKMSNAGGLELGYDWNNSAQNYVSFLNMVDAQWNFVALVVDPTQAVLCLHDGGSFQAVTNVQVNLNQAFEGSTFIGQFNGVNTNVVFNGSIDEVAIFPRSLSMGEVYSQYAAAVGNLPPVFLAEPVAPAQIYASEPLSFTVDAGGTPPLSYQWRKNNNPIAGATSSTFSIANVAAPGDSGNYDVVVTNAFGQIASQIAAVTVSALNPPAITEDPVGRAVYSGGSIRLTAIATGGALHYQWTHAGTNLPGATSSTYLLSSATDADAGTYNVVITNALPGSITSAAATVQVVVPVAGTYEAAVVADAPVAWWRLDEAVGTTLMTDGMGRHDGTYSGITLGVPGVIATGGANTAARFPGTGSSTGLGRVPYSPALNGVNYTIEAWVKTTDVYNGQTAVSSASINNSSQPYQGRGYSIKTSAFSDGLWYAAYGRNSTFAFTVVDLGPVVPAKWTHVVMTYDSAAGQVFYLDGVRVPPSGGYADFTRNSTADFMVGGVFPGAGIEEYFKGDVDEVAYYSTALSTARVQAHYQAALYGSTTPPVITLQPKSQTVSVGTEVEFAAAVEGSQPITLNWYKDGAAIIGATNTALDLSAVDYSSAGSYQLWATNSAGTASSSIATLSVYPSPAFANLTNGLVLHLTFEGGYADASGRGHDATAEGAPTLVEGHIGTNAVQVTTVSASSEFNYVEVAETADLSFGPTDSFTVSFWVKFTGTPDDLPMIGNAEGATYQKGWVFADSGGQIEWTLLDTDGTGAVIADPVGGPAINDGVWHHILASFDRTTKMANTYVDGVQIDSRSIAGVAGSLQPGNPIALGQDPTGGYEVDGSFTLDDVGIWRRALSTFDAQAIYAAGENGGRSFDKFGPVTVFLTPSGEGFFLNWQAGTLVESDTVDGAYTAVAGATAPSYFVTPAAAKKFYRVQL